MSDFLSFIRLTESYGPFVRRFFGYFLVIFILFLILIAVKAKNGTLNELRPKYFKNKRNEKSDKKE